MYASITLTKLESLIAAGSLTVLNKQTQTLFLIPVCTCLNVTLYGVLFFNCCFYPLRRLMYLLCMHVCSPFVQFLYTLPHMLNGSLLIIFLYQALFRMGLGTRLYVTLHGSTASYGERTQTCTFENHGNLRAYLTN